MTDPTRAINAAVTLAQVYTTLKQAKRNANPDTPQVEEHSVVKENLTAALQQLSQIDPSTLDQLDVHTVGAVLNAGSELPIASKIKPELQAVAQAAPVVIPLLTRLFKWVKLKFRK